MTQPLRPALRPIDEARAARLVLAFSEGDRRALDLVLAEVFDDGEGATAALIFALAQITAELVVLLEPDTYADRIRGTIARKTLEAEAGR